MSEFKGFPEATFRFLAGITANNHKTWFEQNRADYEAGYIEPAKAFVSAVGPALQAFAPDVRFEPKVGGSLMRIFRDVRFSKDKSPYKTHLDAWFRMGEERGFCRPGFFFRLTADRVMLGAGMHELPKEVVEAYRTAVLDNRKGPALERALASIREAGPYQVGAPERAKVPRGFDASHPRAELLRHDGLHAGYEVAIPPEARTSAFPEWCARHFQAVSPVSRWLAEALA